jgi:hypothetical protein
MTNPYFAAPYFSYPYSYLHLGGTPMAAATAQDQITADAANVADKAAKDAAAADADATFNAGRAALVATLAQTGPVAVLSADGTTVVRYDAGGTPPTLEVETIPIAGTVALPPPPAS